MFTPPFRRARFLSFLTFCLASQASLASQVDELRISNRTDLLNQSVTGPGKASSFYHSGTHVLHETDMRWAGRAFDGTWDALFNGTLRYTDTSQFDPERLSLQKFEWRLSDADTQINVGDYFANLSPYSMTKGIKGVALQQNLSNDQNYIRAFYGSFDGQWAFAYKTRRRSP